MKKRFPELPPRLAEFFQNPRDLASLLCAHPPLQKGNGSLPSLSKSRMQSLLVWADQRALSGYLHSALASHPSAPLSQEEREGLWKAFAWNSARTARFCEELGLVAEWSRYSGIPVMILKGGGDLAAPTNPFSSSRYMSDLDILVPVGRMEEAYRGLMDCGYQPLQDNQPVHNHWTPLAREASAGRIEIHHQPVSRPAFDRAELDNLWRQAITVEWEGFPVKVPSPTDRLYLRVLHDTLHEHLVFDFPFIHLYEIACLLTVHSDRIDWDRLESRMRRLGIDRFFAVFLLLVHHLFGVNLPDQYSGFSADRAVADIAHIAATVRSGVPKWGKPSLLRLIFAQIKSSGWTDWLSALWEELLYKPNWKYSLWQFVAPPLREGSSSASGESAALWVARFLVRPAVLMGLNTLVCPYWAANFARARRLCRYSNE